MIWLVVFLSYLAQIIGEDQHFFLEENQDWRGVFFRIGRVGNTAKALTPLILFFIRIQDPLIRKRIWTPLMASKKDKKKVESSSSSKSVSTASSTRRSTTLDQIDARPRSDSISDSARPTEELLENLEELVAQDEDDLMWMNLLPSKIKESYTRTFLACIQSKFTEQLELKKNSVCLSEEDTQDVIMYNIDGHSMMKTLESAKSIIDCKFTVYCPALFREVIESHYMTIDIAKSLNIHLNAEKIKKAGESGGGASGELFMFSHDGKLILKTANHDEVEVFTKIMLSYKNHLKEHHKSQIGKILGLFDFNFEGSDRSIKLILMENLFTLSGDIIMRKYDMKGSKHSRKVLKTYENVKSDTVVDKIMKDLDFLEIDKEICLSQDKRDELVRSIEADVAFFTNHNIIDYSLILAVV